MFKAIQLTKDGEAFAARVADLDEAQLPEGDVLVRVSHSTINYKDVISAEVQPEDLVAAVEDATGPGRMVRTEFARTASRLREMQSRDYFARKHASAENPRVMQAR